MMHEARVLVVDDSAAMRALFTDILEQVKDVRVVGVAANAAEAREQIEELRPNVLTLDVEMPGMSGIEFLEEIMTERPMPVVMLSSLTQSGADTSLKAYDLGAIECFPKPLKATPEQFAKTVSKLGKIVLAAANSNVRDRARKTHASGAAGNYAWNGRHVAIGASLGGIDALNTLLSTYPATCPPTIVTLGAEPALAESFIARLARELKCDVAAASDGAEMVPGKIYIAYDPARHVIVEPGETPRLRLIERDPVDGARPSATLLFGTLARSGLPAIGAVLTGIGGDGAKGLKLLRDAGGHTLVQDRATATFSEAPEAAIAADGAVKELALHALAAEIVTASNKG